jgi:uncharacterized membrane protein (DUF2068 family)
MTTETAHTSEQASQSRWTDGITLLAAYHFGVAALFLLGTMVLSIPVFILGIVGVSEDAGAFIGMFAVGVIALVLMVLGLLDLAVGYGLWKRRSWARVAAIALALVSLIFVPIGTISGAITLWYLLQPEVAARFT